MRETNITKNDIKKFCKILAAMAKYPDLWEEAINRTEGLILVEVKILLGGGVWWTDPPNAKLISGSKVIFSNESNKFHIKMRFAGERVSPKSFKIPAKGKKAVRIKPGGKAKIKVELWSRRVGSTGAWIKRDGTGNGADMQIDDP